MKARKIRLCGDVVEIGKLKADDIKKALEEKLDEWEDYIREVNRRNLKGLRRFD